MERHFSRSMDELPVIFEYLEEAIATMSLNAGAAFALNMVVEELYTNMVKYNGNGADDILIGVDRAGDRLEIQLTDSDSEPFDPEQHPDVDTSAGLHERTPGGLGIHIVTRMMDEVSYEYKNRKTSIRLIKNLAPDA